MSKDDKIAIVIFVSLILLFFTYLIGYRFYSLKDSKETIAIYKGVTGSAKGKKKIVWFKIDNKKNVTAEIPFQLRLKIGDTIWIKYSKFDPSIVEVVDIDYKKYLKVKNRTANLNRNRATPTTNLK